MTSPHPGELEECDHVCRGHAAQKHQRMQVVGETQPVATTSDSHGKRTSEQEIDFSLSHSSRQCPGNNKAVFPSSENSIYSSTARVPHPHPLIWEMVQEPELNGETPGEERASPSRNAVQRHNPQPHPREKKNHVTIFKRTSC